MKAWLLWTWDRGTRSNIHSFDEVNEYLLQYTNTIPQGKLELQCACHFMSGLILECTGCNFFRISHSETWAI